MTGEAERIELLGRAERNLPQDLAAPEVDALKTPQGGGLQGNPSGETRSSRFMP